MSNWTHVAAIFRIDSFGHTLNFTEIFGKELNYGDQMDKWEEATHILNIFFLLVQRVR